MQVSSQQNDVRLESDRNEARIFPGHPKDFTAVLTSLQDFDRLWQSTYAVFRGNIWDPVTNPNGSKIARFASTAMVARDLVELAERHGQWREKQAHLNATAQATLHRLKWKRGEEPLLVSMISYGTLLGTTLAAMQPHRVHRFHLDGVTDAAEYYAGELTSDTDGSDPVVGKFFEYCALAGPDLCPMWAGNASIDTQRRLEDIYTDIRLNGPIPVSGTSIVDPDIITLSDVKTKVLALLYSPITMWPEVASIIAPLTDRNGTAFAASKQSVLAGAWGQLSEAFDPDNPATAPSFSGAWAGAMIQGGDSSARLSQAEFARTRWAPLRKVTKWTGDQWASTYLALFNWPITFGWRYGDKHAVASNVTANPILFASTLHFQAQDCSSRMPRAILLALNRVSATRRRSGGTSRLVSCPMKTCVAALTVGHYWARKVLTPNIWVNSTKRIRPSMMRWLHHSHDV
jgi:pimeloyl-ACP methyl ester carboxylesterase